ncbi:MAG: GTP-binding protein [Planctomycetota bacterium]
MSIPVTLLAGFLGTGKTTLVRRLLARAREEPSERIAVVVNEFGALGIDGDLVVREEGDGASSIVELAGGCICCEIQDDLRTALLELVGVLGKRRGGPLRWLRPARPDVTRVVVEASGAASPGAAVQTLLVDEAIAQHLRLAGVVTLTRADVDPSEREGAAGQIAYADRVLVNHSDRVDEDAARAAVRRIEAQNPLADVRTTVHADVPSDWVLADAARAPVLPEGPLPHAHDANGLTSISLESERPVDPEALRMMLEFLGVRGGVDLMRAKGILRAGGGAGLEAHGLELQGVDRWLEIGRLAGGAPATSRLVLIGRGLDEDEVRRGWEATLA